MQPHTLPRSNPSPPNNTNKIVIINLGSYKRSVEEGFKKIETTLSSHYNSRVSGLIRVTNMSKEHPSIQIRTKKEHRGQGMSSLHGAAKTKYEEEADTRSVTSSSCSNGRERLQRHRKEVAGKVWIPEIWGQEELLKDWVDCSEFDACLVPSGVVSARAALAHQASSPPNM